MSPRLTLAATVLAVVVLATGCSSSNDSSPTAAGSSPSSSGSAPSAGPVPSATAAADVAKQNPRLANPLPGMPPVLDPRNIYSADTPNDLSPKTRGDRSLVYVPNSESNTVDVIDQKTMKVVNHFAVGALPQHVVPSYDLSTLWVTNDKGNTLTAIDPKTGKKGRTIPVEDPYNMYYTPDGKYALVVAERLEQLDFYDAHTMKLRVSLPVPTCAGVDHMDFSANGRYAIVSCEFSGRVIKVDVAAPKVLASIKLRSPRDKPQDVKLSPDGSVFYVADMVAGGVWKIDGERAKLLGFLETGKGAHGLYASRDAKMLYVTNRDEGSISVIDFATGKQVAKWHIPGGGSPDMGNVSVDGKVLWLSGRYNSVVYAISTKDGHLIAKIPVGKGPHGLAVWPQPGRYSLGHTGIMR